LRPAIVTQTIKDFLDLEDAIGGHAAAEIKVEKLSQAYTSIALMIGAGDEEIALMKSHTILKYLPAFFGSLLHMAGCRTQFFGNLAGFIRRKIHGDFNFSGRYKYSNPAFGGRGNLYVGDIYGERAQKFVPITKRR